MADWQVGGRGPRPLAHERLRAREIIHCLKDCYPDADCTLDYQGRPFRLLVGAILAAQCTDARVNMVTPALFARYPEVEDMAAASPEDLIPYIRSCGFFRNKARSLQGAAAYLMAEHGGEVPCTEAELLRIPGVGRKIANLLLGDIYGQQAVVVDTHCGRISRLLGFTKEQNPTAVERDLCKKVPQEYWTDWGHLLVEHGRACCRAGRPDCIHCALAPLCDHFQGGALRLVPGSEV